MPNGVKKEAKWVTESSSFKADHYSVQYKNPRDETQFWIQYSVQKKKMAQIAKVSAEVQLKSPAEKFHGFFRNRMDHLVQMFPKNLRSFEFLEGNDFIDGALMYWKYDIVGPTEMKARVKDVDEENKSITYEIVEGDVLSQYSLFKIKFQVVDNGENDDATVNWSLEYEKANEDVPSPEIYMKFACKISMGLDAYISNN